MKTKKVAEIGMLIALAFVLSYIESLIPIHFGIPGIKLGLSNIVVLFCLYMHSPSTAFGLSMVRILLTGLTFGNLSTMLYSFAGGILSYLVMLLLIKTEKFSVYGVSIAGAVAHNLGQLLIAMVILRTQLLLYYFPFLMISGLVAGTAIGMLGGTIINRIKNHV